MTHPVYVDSLQYKYLLTSQTILKIQKQIVHSLKKQREMPPLSLTNTFSQTQHTHIILLAASHSYTHMLSYTHSLTHSHFLTNTTHTYYFTPSHSLLHTHAFLHTLSHSLALSYKHTTHTHALKIGEKISPASVLAGVYELETQFLENRFHFRFFC